MVRVPDASFLPRTPRPGYFRVLVLESARPVPWTVRLLVSSSWVPDTARATPHSVVLHGLACHTNSVARFPPEYPSDRQLSPAPGMCFLYPRFPCLTKSQKGVLSSRVFAIAFLLHTPPRPGRAANGPPCVPSVALGCAGWSGTIPYLPLPVNPKKKPPRAPSKCSAFASTTRRRPRRGQTSTRQTYKRPGKPRQRTLLLSH